MIPELLEAKWNPSCSLILQKIQVIKIQQLKKKLKILWNIIIFFKDDIYLFLTS